MAAMSSGLRPRMKPTICWPRASGSVQLISTHVIESHWSPESKTRNEGKLRRTGIIMIVGTVTLSLNDETKKTAGAHSEEVFVLDICQE
jgi:hypothetical protein